MLKYVLPKSAVRAVQQVVGALFNRARKRLFNKDTGPKGIRFGYSVTESPPAHREDLSLRRIFDEAAKAEGTKPDPQLYRSIEQGVEDYLAAHEKLAVARVTNAVQAYLHEVDLGSTKADPDKVLQDTLGEVFDKVTSGVKEVVDTETTKARNMSTLEAISKVSAVVGVDDPTVYFAGPVDGHTCKDCIKLYFLEDRITPRVWKTSELKAGYWKRGDPTPCIGGLHPNCRHALCSILPGYGFKAGKLTFIAPGYDVFKDQRD